jgi:hypothetical protein
MAATTHRPPAHPEEQHVGTFRRRGAGALRMLHAGGRRGHSRIVYARRARGSRL